MPRLLVCRGGVRCAWVLGRRKCSYSRISMCRRVGAVGVMDVDEWVGCIGDAGRRGEGGVASLWRIELTTLACSGSK